MKHLDLNKDTIDFICTKKDLCKVKNCLFYFMFSEYMGSILI